MSTTHIPLGGMALPNGVLVHGPRHWACAVRTAEGELKVASGEKPLKAADAGNRFARAPLRIAEIFPLLAEVRRRLPEAVLPFQRPAVAGAMAGSVVALRALRRTRLSPLARESLGALLSLGPALVALRGSSLAEYHGAEHISIGSYEHGEPRTREHERCGSHLVGPLLATTAVGSALAARAPQRLRPAARMAAGLGAVAASVEVFTWMVANERHPVARALARPGHELQQRVVTAEPSEEQLEVAGAAVTECLRLESGVDGGGDQAPEEAPPA
ncbi:MAG TPA: DUF1385 domain-containing protein [Gaiellaceae bacterium]|nr:DUF1385 domain-containing protein [Gaiellaceae bacterium]